MVWLLFFAGWHNGEIKLRPGVLMDASVTPGEGTYLSTLRYHLRKERYPEILYSWTCRHHGHIYGGN